MMRRNCLLTVALLSAPLFASAKLGERLQKRLGERRLEGDSYELDFEARHADAYKECDGDAACIMQQMTEFVESLNEAAAANATLSPTSAPTGGPTSDLGPVTIVQDAGGVPNLGPSDASNPPPDLDFLEDPGPPPLEDPGPPPSDIDVPEIPGFAPEDPIVPPQNAGDGDLPDVGGDLPDIGGDLPEVPEVPDLEDPQDGGDAGLPDIGGGLPDIGGGLPDIGDLPDIGGLPNIGDMGSVQDGALDGPSMPDAEVPGLSDAGSGPLLPDAPDLPAANQVADGAGTHGDPHFKTWRNEHFEYHGQCDLVLVKDPEFADGLGLDVQIRTKVVRFWSYIKSVAIRIGTDIFEIEGSPDQEEFNVRYWINLEFQGPAKTIGGFPIIFNSGEGKAMKKQTVVIDLSSKYPGTQIEFQIWKEFIKVNFVKPTCQAFGNSVGMLGNYHTGKTVGRDGVTVFDDFILLGEEWQVLPSDEMLFHSTEDPQFPAKCIEPEEVRGLRRRRRLDEVTVTEEQAEQACASLSDEIDRKDCVYDILATQNLDMVGAY